MKKLLLSAAFLAALASPAAAAIAITVANVGPILNESIPLPAELTPGAGGAFAEFFEFSLPTRETVTLSMSDSAVGFQQITGGSLSLNNQVSISPVSPFQPLGTLIESSPIASFIGGQSATVTPDPLAAGDYFAEISGSSGLAKIRIAVDGTATAVTTPEPSTWAMLLCGFALLTWRGLKGARVSRT